MTLPDTLSASVNLAVIEVPTSGCRFDRVTSPRFLLHVLSLTITDREAVLPPLSVTTTVTLYTVGAARYWVLVIWRRLES